MTADGAAGGRRAAAVLTMALCAETSHTTMDEDGAKIDLKVSMRHPHRPQTLMAVHCQVKSGDSYRAPASKPDTLTLRNISAETIAALRGGSQPALLLWVPPKPSSRIYWHIVHARGANRSPIKIPRDQFVSPSLRFDLSKATACLTGPRGTRQDVAKLSDDEVLIRARKAYKNLKTRVWDYPITGSVTVTRMGWRHVTRRSKSTANRMMAMRVLPYLHSFLDKRPDRYLVGARTVSESGAETLESRQVVCWHENALMINGNVHYLLIRLREVIAYPTLWHRYPLGVGDVQHTATLMSWWCKRSK